MNILIIGATGFIGQSLTERLHADGHHIYLLVRPESLSRARQLFSHLTQVTYLSGDIGRTDILAKTSEASQVHDLIEVVVHLAALYELNASPQDAYMYNVLGTQNVLLFLSRLKKLQAFHYFSTYAVNQLVTGALFEDELIPENSKFYDQYAKTKNQAEHLVRKWGPNYASTVIHRPGIIVGHSQSGKYNKNNGPYYFFDFIHKLKAWKKIANVAHYLPLPVRSQSLIPTLPIDILTDWSTHIINHPISRKLSCYHLTPQQEIPTQEFLQTSIRLLGNELQIKSLPYDSIYPPIFKLLGLPKELVYYMKFMAKIDRSRLQADFPLLTKAPSYQDYLPVLIKTYLEENP